MAGNFTIDVTKWADKIKGRLTAFCQEFAQDVAEELVLATPVKTGFLRGSWYASIGGPALGTGSFDPTGQGSVAQMNLVAANFKPGEVLYMINGASYAYAVEYGSAGRPPRAYVRGTVARAQAIADATAARVAAMP